MKCDVFHIWINNKDNLKGYISKRVVDKSDVDDILQSVLIKFANYCETRNDVQNIKAWIYRITQNTIIDFYKKSNWTTSSDLEILKLQDNQTYDENIFIWLYNFIDDLPGKYSIPLRLSDLERKPQKEIAEQLGLTLEATKSRIQRARKMLIDNLACDILFKQTTIRTTEEAEKAQISASPTIRVGNLDFYPKHLSDCSEAREWLWNGLTMDEPGKETLIEVLLKGYFEPKHDSVKTELSSYIQKHLNANEMTKNNCGCN